MRKRFLLCLLSLSSVGFQAPRERAPMMDSIQREALKADVFFLASDVMRGRLTDTPANLLAAEWIKSRFARIGLKPADPRGSYYHDYYLTTSTLGKENLLRRSDHWPFMQYGIPAIRFLIGLHPDYHTVYDRPEKLNYEKFEKIVKLVYQES